MGTQLVQYQHFRYDKRGRLKRYIRSKPPVGKPDPYASQRFEPLSNGGVTVCSVIVDGVMGTGVAVCQPEDSFCYHAGRSIAYSNALADVARAIRARIKA